MVQNDRLVSSLFRRRDLNHTQRKIRSLDNYYFYLDNPIGY